MGCLFLRWTGPVSIANTTPAQTLRVWLPARVHSVSAVCLRDRLRRRTEDNCHAHVDRVEHKVLSPQQRYAPP